MESVRKKRVGFKTKNNRPHSTEMHAYMHLQTHTHTHMDTYTMSLTPKPRTPTLNSKKSTASLLLSLSLCLPPCLGVLPLSPLSDHQRQQPHEALGLVARPQQVRTQPQRQRRDGRIQPGACNTRGGAKFQTRTPTKRSRPPGV